jgi:hypothetical protein
MQKHAATWKLSVLNTPRAAHAEQPLQNVLLTSRYSNNADNFRENTTISLSLFLRMSEHGVSMLQLRAFLTRYT